MKVRVGRSIGLTDTGRKRRQNEDAFVCEPPLFAIADGMGGAQAGEVASRLAAAVFEEGAAAVQGEEGVATVVRAANARIFERAVHDPAVAGMGTTATVAVVDEAAATVTIAHVGDSRAYLLREGALQQLTQDHTLVQQMVDEGNLDADEAERHPSRHIMTRALGVDEHVAVDQLTLDLHPGDRILLCSDGLTGMLSADDIRDLMERETDAQRTADALVQLAVERGGEDNVTVLIVDVESGDGADADEDAADAAAVGGAAAPDAAAPVDGSGGGPSARDGSTTQVIARADARAMTEAQPQAPAPAAPRKRFRWRRLALWIGAVVFVMVAVWVGVRLYVDHQWYVGVEDGRVAVFQGIPSKPLGFTLSYPEDLTDIPASVAVRLQPWRRLGDGITANSRDDAEALVEQIRADVASLQSVSGPAG
jgi:serine/threonine protein phosphatase PrpC